MNVVIKQHLDGVETREWPLAVPDRLGISENVISKVKEIPQSKYGLNFSSARYYCLKWHPCSADHIGRLNHRASGVKLRVRYSVYSLVSKLKKKTVLSGLSPPCPPPPLALIPDFCATNFILRDFTYIKFQRRLREQYGCQPLLLTIYFTLADF